MSVTPQRILLVDDEQAVLEALCRQHRKRYALVPACGVEAGLKAITEQGPFAVVVTDYQMPGRNGIQFLASVMDLAPDMVRIMFTGQADLRVAIEAINQGTSSDSSQNPANQRSFRQVWMPPSNNTTCAMQSVFC